MEQINIEIKAKSNNQDMIREILKSKNSDFKGIDHQIDTYFKVNFGRLKLREGQIENYLIYYDRENKEGPKQSNVTLFKSDPESSFPSAIASWPAPRSTMRIYRRILHRPMHPFS